MDGLSAIILSYTKNEKIHRMTLDCIRTLEQSEDFINQFDLEIILIESNRSYIQEGYAYPDNVSVIIPDVQFNFHAYLNMGIAVASQPFIALCNNDLIFHEGWFSEMMNVKKVKPEIRSFCPVQPKEKTTFNVYEIGYNVRTHIKGWCIVVEKELFKTIGPLDEQFDFYYADDDYAMTLRKYHIDHALVYRSIVEHLGGENTETMRKEGNAEYNEIIGKYPDLPAYLYTDGYSWILKNEKLLNGHMKFHKKWGGVRIIPVKNRMHKMLSKVGLGGLVRW